MMPAWLTTKVIGYAAGALAILAFIGLSLHWRHEMTARGEQLSSICTATRAASNLPKLKCSEVPQQITFLGEAVTTLKGGISDQNAKVAALGQQTAQAQQEAAKASQEAAGRAKRASAASDSLTASARAPERLTKPCEPSKALQGAWK